MSKAVPTSRGWITDPSKISTRTEVKTAVPGFLKIYPPKSVIRFSDIPPEHVDVCIN